MSDTKLSHEAIALLKSLFITDANGVVAMNLKMVDGFAVPARAINSTNGFDIAAMLNKCLSADAEGLVSLRVALRNTKRVASAVSGATLTVNSDTTDMAVRTLQAANLTIANPTGTPTDGQELLIRLKCDGTERTLTYGSEFRAMGVALPAVLVINKTTYLHLVRNAADTKWDLVKVSQQA